MPLLVVLLLLTLTLATYWRTAWAMGLIWERSGTFAHCFLVAPISLWLIWRRRSALAPMVPRPEWPWLLPMALAALGWLLGDLASVNALTQFALVVLLILAVPLVCGLRVSLQILFPLAFLLFMVPFGEFLLPQMMDWTADFTVAALRATGVPVYREGLQFVIPSGTWSVVEACSGIRYLIASFMVGSLFAYLNYTSARKRAVFAVFSLLLPIVANWLRAYMIVMIGHLSGNRLAVGVDHIIYGWVFFGLIIGLMFYIGARWADPVAEPQVPGALAEVTARPAAAWVAALALGAVAAGFPQAARTWIDSRESQQGPTSPLALPTLPGTGDSSEVPELVPSFQNPVATALRAYSVDDGVVWVHVAYYRRQDYGRKLISSENELVKGEDSKWQQIGQGLKPIPKGTAVQTWRFTELRAGSVSALSAQRRRLDLRQTYWVAQGFTTSPLRAAWTPVLGRLLGQGDDAAGVTVYTEGADPATTSARLERFLREHTDAIERQLVTYRALRTR